MALKQAQGSVVAPTMLAGEEIELQPLGRAGRLVDAPHLLVAPQRRVDQEAGVVGADVDQQRSRRQQPLQIGQIDEL
jgi:hypothetical protein